MYLIINFFAIFLLIDYSYYFINFSLASLKIVPLLFPWQLRLQSTMFVKHQAAVKWTWPGGHLLPLANFSSSTSWSSWSSSCCPVLHVRSSCPMASVHCPMSSDVGSLATKTARQKQAFCAAQFWFMSWN